eukprot:6172148-Pleurochrysis_carterae.AAC.1
MPAAWRYHSRAHSFARPSQDTGAGARAFRRGGGLERPCDGTRRRWTQAATGVDGWGERAQNASRAIVDSALATVAA